MSVTDLISLIEIFSEIILPHLVQLIGPQWPQSPIAEIPLWGKDVFSIFIYVLYHSSPSFSPFYLRHTMKNDHFRTVNHVQNDSILFVCEKRIGCDIAHGESEEEVYAYCVIELFRQRMKSEYERAMKHMKHMIHTSRME